jgi:hypothetical protein
MVLHWGFIDKVNCPAVVSTLGNMDWCDNRFHAFVRGQESLLRRKH